VKIKANTDKLQIIATWR